MNPPAAVITPRGGQPPPKVSSSSSSSSASAGATTRKRRLETAIQERKDGDPLPLLLEQGFESTEFRLLEAPSEVMEALEQGSSLRIVGRSREEPAALVTDTATFEICRVETSNMLLLVPPLVEDKEKEEEGGVIGKVAYHYELKRSKPKQDELRKLLSVNSGGAGGKGEGGSADKIWTLEELEQRVQGSREEVLAMIGTMNALEVPGGWKAVDESVIHPALDRLLSEITIAGMNLDEVVEEECIKLLDDVEPVLIRHCLKAYGKPLVEQGRWALDLGKVAVFKAHQVFQKGMDRPQREVWNLKDFLLEWETILPGTFHPDPELLKGVALKETIGQEECVRYLPSNSMPRDPVLRLKKLFEAKRKWTLQEMEVYLSGLIPAKTTLPDFLMKHARSSVSPDGSGDRIYSAK